MDVCPGEKETRYENKMDFFLGCSSCCIEGRKESVLPET